MSPKLFQKRKQIRTFYKKCGRKGRQNVHKSLKMLPEMTKNDNKCPSCGRVEKMFKKVTQNHGPDVPFWGHFPEKLQSGSYEKKHISQESSKPVFCDFWCFYGSRGGHFWHRFLKSCVFCWEREASRKWWYLQGIWTIGEGPGVPDSSKWKKKRLAEFSVFSVGQKTRREAILTI